jgi:hypothetical protein
MRIDIHTHILPESLPDLTAKYGYAGWLSVQRTDTDPNRAHMMKDGKLFRTIEKNCWCLHERCNEMKSSSVTTQILSTVPVMFNYWAKPEHTLDACHMLNDDLCTQIRSFRNACVDIDGANKWFYGFGTVPMQHPQMAIDEMTRCVQDLGFNGIQIGSHINDWQLDAKQLFPFWKVILGNPPTALSVHKKNAKICVCVCFDLTASRRAQLSNIYPSVGHGTHNTHNKILATMAGWHASGNNNSHLLHTHGRCSATLSTAQVVLCTRRRCVSVHNWTHTTWLRAETRSVCSRLSNWP